MKENNAITNRDVDFAKWYTDVIKAAHLAEYTSVKGCVAIEPNGYAIWERMQQTLDKMFKDLGHVNVCLPLLIPESLLQKEKDHVEGFAPEVAWVTRLGNKDLEERLCIRPTSETLFCEYWKNKLHTYRDLPFLHNQWVNVFRNEKETRPFLRSREFLWQEGHTLHETKEEAMQETDRMLNVYKTFFEEYLAIPVISGRKTEKEKFAGAEYTLTIEALMHNGICLQSATSHFFGDGFAKAFDITYLSKDNKREYPYQTSWGSTTRMIAALIMVHGDNKGLVLPPKIAPKQVVIIPIGKEDSVKEQANLLNARLNKIGIMSYVDDSNKSPGFRFAEAEVNGIPVRVEIGPRDLANNAITLARRDKDEKITVSIDALEDKVTTLLKDIQNNLYNQAKKRMESMTYTAKNMDEFKEIIENHPGFVKAMWCGSQECEEKIKEIRGCKSRCIPEEQEHISDTCVCCGKKAKHMVYWGIQY